VLQGASAGQRRALGRAEVLVGRDPAADLVLEDTGVSRRHFKILRASDDIYNLVDLASTNGVQVNGVRVDVAILREHDRIDVGPVARLRFTFEAPSQAAVTPPALAPLLLGPRQLEVRGWSARARRTPRSRSRWGSARGR